jgi:ABC-type amino acid transport system permease subunit
MNISYQEFDIILLVATIYYLICFILGEIEPRIDTRMLFIVRERISQ